MNRQGFDTSTPGGMEHLHRLLDTLLAYNQDTGNRDYNDIRVYPGDCHHMYVEWDRAPFDPCEGWGGSFQWVGVGDEVYTEATFPDGHTEMVQAGTEREAVDNWMESHPGWEVDRLGTWTNAIEDAGSAIASGIGTWMSMEPAGQDGFQVSTLDIGECKDLGITQMMLRMDPGVLRRTDSIVMAGEASMPLTHMSCIQDGYFVPSGDGGMLLGTAYIPLEYRDPWMESPEKSIREVRVYQAHPVDGDGGQRTCLVYLTQDNYPIARQDLVQGKATGKGSNK